MKTKDDKVIAKISSEEKLELIELSHTLDIPISQIVRDGVRKQVAELKQVAADKAKVNGRSKRK